MWHTGRETNCSRCTTSQVIVGKVKTESIKEKEQVLADGGSLAALWEIGGGGGGRCELDRARGYYSN